MTLNNVESYLLESDGEREFSAWKCGNLWDPHNYHTKYTIHTQHTCINMEKPLRVARRETMVSENTCHEPTNSEPKQKEEVKFITKVLSTE